MKHFATYSTLLLLLSFGPAAYAQFQSDSIAVKTNWKEQKTKSYVITYPPQWSFNENTSGGVEGFVLHAPKPEEATNYPASVNLSIQDISDKGLNLDKYTILSERQIHTLVDNSKLIISERIDSVDKAFHQIVYIGDYDTHKLKWKMRFWVGKDQVFVLTYTASKEDFGLHAEIAEEIMNSFQIR